MSSTSSSSSSAFLEPSTDLCCPVTLSIFEDPMKASDGFTYEKIALRNIFLRSLMKGENFPPSPMTRESLENKMIESEEMQIRLLLFRERRRSFLLNERKKNFKNLNYYYDKNKYERLIADDNRAIHFLKSFGSSKPEWSVIISSHDEDNDNSKLLHVPSAPVITTLRSIGWNFCLARKAFDTSNDGWSFGQMKRLGMHSPAILIRLDIICNEQKSVLMAFNNGPMKGSSSRPYGQDGFVSMNDNVYLAFKGAHMTSKKNLIDFGEGALRITDDFAVSSEISTIYDSPSLTPVHAEFDVERVRLFVWSDAVDDEPDLSVLEDPQYEWARVLLDTGTGLNRTHITRNHFG